MTPNASLIFQNLVVTKKQQYKVIAMLVA